MSVWRQVTCALAIVSSQATAQRPATTVEKPEDVARRFLMLLDSARFVDAARLLQPDGVVKYRDVLIAGHRITRKAPTATVEDLLKADPEMPRAVAEYRIARMSRDDESMWMSQYIGFEFANVFDTLSLKQMGALELGARWLEAKDMRYQSRRGRMMDPRCQKLTPADIAQLDSMVAASVTPREVLGAIVRADTAFVLHRPRGTFEDEGETQTFMYGILVMVRGPGWRILPTQSFMHAPSVSFVSSCEGP